MFPPIPPNVFPPGGGYMFPLYTPNVFPPE